MRFILTGAVWAVILSAVFLVFSIRAPEVTAHTVDTDKGKTSVSFEITTTFGVEKDPFALDIGDEVSAFSLTLDGETIFSAQEGVHDRVPFVTVEAEIPYGQHELFVKANPSENGISQAVRIKVLNHGNTLNEETYWFQAGQTVNASHKFTIEEKDEKNEH